jgi:hypothetical protein
MTDVVGGARAAGLVCAAPLSRRASSILNGVARAA